MSVLTRGAADFVVAVVTDAAAGDLVAVTVLGAGAVAAWDFERAGFISLTIKIHNPAEFVAQMFMVCPNQIYFSNWLWPIYLVRCNTRLVNICSKNI